MRNCSNYILLLLFTGLSLSFQAQDSVPDKRLNSREQIRSLKEGALLVRLSTKQNSIDALTKAGRTEQAEQVRQQNRKRNLELVEAMEKAFTFCPVYFFYSYDSKHVKMGNLDSVQFLNSDLQHDPSIAIASDDYYTAEVTLIAQDTSEKQKNLSNNEEKDVDYKNEPKYYGGANLRFEALIIKDDQFVQLRRPFPYYARTLNSFFIKRKLIDVVSTMDSKLWKFYGK